MSISSVSLLRNLTCLLPVILVCALAGTSVKAQPNGEGAENPFPGRFPAPELDGGTEWLNTSGPISLRDLRGKIVLLDFWTYCCINCIHVLPDLKYLEEKYADQLVVIGVHSAKFENEKESENIRQAVLRYEIEHPVVNDSNMTIARKYGFNSWPTLVLIDPQGNYVGRQPGEGTRDLFDNVIGKLVEFHRSKGTLDETPINFHLEREKEPSRPLRFPGKVLVDEPNERIFISDSNNNRVVIASLAGELIDVVGNGRIGADDGSFAEATFDHPHGMTLVGNVLYLADTENHMIRAIDLEARQVTTLAGTGVQARFRATGGPLGETPLNSPWALQELDGEMYVAMAGPHQLWRHTLGTGTIRVYAGSGHEDITDGPLEAAALAQPSGITTDGSDLFLVDSEGSAVRRIGTGNDAQVTTVVGPHDLPRGRALFEFGDIDGVGKEVRLQHPLGIAYHEGGLYVADSYNHKIKYVDLESRNCETWLGTGEWGDGLEPVQLFEPAGVSVSGTHLYIADTNNHRILKADLKTKETEPFIVDGLQPPDPPQTTDEEPFAGRTVTLDPVTVKQGESLAVTVEFKLPEGNKLNQLAPVIYRLESEQPQELIAAESLEGRRRAEAAELSARITLPLTGTTGENLFKLTVSYQYCRDGVGGVCRYGSQQWEVPLTVAADGLDELSLTAEPK